MSDSIASVKPLDDADPFLVVLPPRAAPGGPGATRFGIAFGLSLGVHALFFLMLAIAMGRTETAPPSTAVEFVLVDFSLSGEPSSSREAAAAPTEAAAPEPVAETTESESAIAKPALPARPSVTRTKPERAQVSPDRLAYSPEIERVRPMVRSVAVGSRARADEGVELAVSDWLRRFQKYPRAARRAGLEGTAQVRFVIDRSGTLRERELTASSGHSILDRAALELLARAAPYPPLPSRIAVELIELTMPVEYRLADVRG